MDSRVSMIPAGYQQLPSPVRLPWSGARLARRWGC